MLTFPILLVLYEVVVYLSDDMYLPALPIVRGDFGLDIQASQAAITMWLLGSGFCQWYMGPLSDSIGRKPVLIGSIVIYCITCLICGNTNNYNVFLFARFFQGAMIGPIFVSGYAAIHEKYSTEQTIKILATMSCITVFAPIVGPIIGAKFLLIGSWQSIFNMLSFTAGIIGLLLFFKMPETLTTAKKFTLKNIFQDYLDTLSLKPFILPILANCCTFASVIAWLVMSPFIANKYGLNTQDYAYLQAFTFSFYLIGNRSIPIALKKFSPERIVKFGMLFSLSLGSALFLFYLMSNNFKVGITAVAAISLGSGMCGPNLQKIGINASDQPMGLKMAVYSTMISLSAALISFLTSLLQNNLSSLLWTMLACILLSTTWIYTCRK